MSARSEKPKNRRVKLVGGGFRHTRQENSGGSGSSAKSVRRALRKQAKAKGLSKEQRSAARKFAKQQIREMFIAKNARNN